MCQFQGNVAYCNNCKTTDIHARKMIVSNYGRSLYLGNYFVLQKLFLLFNNSKAIQSKINCVFVYAIEIFYRKTILPRRYELHVTCHFDGLLMIQIHSQLYVIHDFYNHRKVYNSTFLK